MLNSRYDPSFVSVSAEEKRRRLQQLNAKAHRRKSGLDDRPNSSSPAQSPATPKGRIATSEDEARPVQTVSVISEVTVSRAEAEAVDATKDSAKKEKRKRKASDSDGELVLGETSVLDDEEVEEEVRETHSAKRKRLRQIMTETAEMENSEITPPESKLLKDSEIAADTFAQPQVEGEGETTDFQPKAQEDFTILEAVEEKKKTVVSRVLPHWLSHPTTFSHDIQHTRLDDSPHLGQRLKTALRDKGIDTLFPVQAALVPALMKQAELSLCFRPPDVCVSAPTGSGKTLAFVLPIVQCLEQSVGREVKCLAILPTRDLASQVADVFKAYCKNTRLKVALVTGEKKLSEEQFSLVRKNVLGEWEAKVDIMVATPGRLVDHIADTPGFCLAGLRYLIIDEADHVMREVQYDWLRKLEDFVGRVTSASALDGLCPATARKRPFLFQKLLFSATLLQNPERLQPLKLFMPLLFSSASGVDQVADSEGGKAESVRSSQGTLTEYFCECEGDQRALVVLHLLHNLKFRRMLIFTRTRDTTYRLSELLKLYGGGVKVAALSSLQRAGTRNAVLAKFGKGVVDVLVCSEKVARGMDMPGVRVVVSYEPPTTLESHIHRTGRTARAGRAGTSITILERKQVYHFKKLLKEAGRVKPSELLAPVERLEPLVPAFTAALSQLTQRVQAEGRLSKV